MADLGEENTYCFPVTDFDTSLLPPHARTPGTDAFREEVSKQIQRDFAEFTGWVKIAVSGDMIQVSWRQDPKRPTPMQVALGKIDRGEFAEAVRILDHLHRQEPDNPQVLYNLGLALSDLGQPQLAEIQLRATLDVDPDNVSAMVALGLSLSQQERTAEAIEVFRAAVARDTNNMWAHRNLGALLFASGKTDEAVPHLQRAYELNPQDQQAAFGYAQALEAKGEFMQAREQYTKTIAMNEQSQVAEAARQEQTSLAEKLFRRGMPNGVRPDAVVYCMDALRRFAKMTPEQVGQVRLEIANVGREGVDMSGFDRKYTLRSLPGQYAGLHLVCLMYVAFQQVAPDVPTGLDLSKEYEVAKKMLEEEGKK